MAPCFKTSTVCVTDLHCDGHRRRWLEAYGPQADVPTEAAAQLHGLTGKRA